MHLIMPLTEICCTFSSFFNLSTVSEFRYDIYIRSILDPFKWCKDKCGKVTSSIIFHNLVQIRMESKCWILGVHAINESRTALLTKLNTFVYVVPSISCFIHWQASILTNYGSTLKQNPEKRNQQAQHYRHHLQIFSVMHWIGQNATPRKSMWKTGSFLYSTI